MNDDVIKLIGRALTGYDDYGNEIITPDVVTEFCKAESISRNEFYAAASAGLKPEWRVTISNAADYHGEELAEFHGEIYSVIRTYRDGDAVELTLEKKVGDESE